MPGNKLGESKENPTEPSKLYQYKVNIPEVGETVVYANSPAELARKLRMIIMPAHRKDIKIERIMPAAAGKLFMDKRMKHMRNIVKEEMGADEGALKKQMKEFVLKERRAAMKKQELQKELQQKLDS